MDNNFKLDPETAAKLVANIRHTKSTPEDREEITLDYLATIQPSEVYLPEGKEEIYVGNESN